MLPRHKTAGVLFAAIGVLGLAWYAGPDVQQIVAGIEWMRDAGPLGDAAFALFYGISSLLLFPASWNHGAAGFLYGPIWGMAVTSLYSTAFSSIAFLLGRFVLRERVERRLAESPTFHALDGALAEQGLKLVILVRLSPLSPFNPVTYLFAASRVSLRDFVLGTFIGGAVPCFVFARLGASVSNLADMLGGKTTGSYGVQIFGLVVTLIVTVLISWLAKNALATATAGTNSPPDHKM